MKLKTALFAAAATLAIAPAANAYQGVYGAIGAGLSYIGPDRDFEGTGALAFDSEADYENGIGVYTALGHEGANGWRKEFEFSYRTNDLRHFPGDGAGFTGWNEANVDGDVQSMAFMFNLIKNFKSDSKVTPYAGIGAGMARLKADYVGNAAPFIPAGFGTLNVQDKAWEFAYQGIAGLAFELAEGLALDLSYRYFATLDPKFDGTLGGAAEEFNQEYTSHSLFAGLRWNFGAAAPAAPQYKDCWDGSSVPVAAECPPQPMEETTGNLDPINVIVYFDYDKSNLTPEASNLIKEAAARALANDVDTVVVSGHADRSGGSAYNQALSERRGAVVRDALIANGISADKIRMESYGEDRPAKPTEDGVREPLNRRTEVTISFQ